MNADTKTTAGEPVENITIPLTSPVIADDLIVKPEVSIPKMSLVYDDPLAAVFLRILAWEKHVAKRELLVKDIVSDQVQMARLDLGLKKNTKGAPHAFIQSLRKRQPPLLVKNALAEKGWANNHAWSLRHLPSHRLVRTLSWNPIWFPIDLASEQQKNNSNMFQFSIALRDPALPKLILTVGSGKPTAKTPGDVKGVYFLREDNAFYIGQSDEFIIRCPQHRMKERKFDWWVFISPQELNGTFPFDSLYAAESLLISFWAETCSITNRTRGKDKEPNFGFLQPAIMFVVAASAALLWLIREQDLKFTKWTIPFKPKCSGRGWPACYLANPVKEVGS